MLQMFLGMYLIPDDCVWLSCSARGPNWEDQPAVPRYQQQSQYLRQVRTTTDIGNGFYQRMDVHRWITGVKNSPCVPSHCQGGSSVEGSLWQWRAFLGLDALVPDRRQREVKYCRPSCWSAATIWIEIKPTTLAAQFFSSTWMPGGMS